MINRTQRANAAGYIAQLEARIEDLEALNLGMLSGLEEAYATIEQLQAKDNDDES